MQNATQQATTIQGWTHDNWEYPRPSILCQTRYWTIMMPIIEAGSAVPGQNDGKKTVYIILYPEGTSRSSDESGLFYLIT